MGFWQVTLKRSTSLSKSYFIIGTITTVYGVVLSNIMTIFPSASNSNTNTPVSVDLTSNFPLLSIALLSLSAVLFALPVIMLYVYDKNNGVLEYLLSTRHLQRLRESLTSSSNIPANLCYHTKHSSRCSVWNQFDSAGYYSNSYFRNWHLRSISRKRLHGSFQFPSKNTYGRKPAIRNHRRHYPNVSCSTTATCVPYIRHNR